MVKDIDFYLPFLFTIFISTDFPVLKLYNIWQEESCQNDTTKLTALTSSFGGEKNILKMSLITKLL